MMAEGGKEDEDTGAFCKKDLDYLIGNLEKLPASARKLFNMGKLYLMTGSTEEKNHQGFTSLFESFPAQQNEHSEAGSANAPGDVSTDEKNLCQAESLFMPLRKSAPLYHAQTFIQWKAGRDLNNFYALCMPKKNTVYLQPIDNFPEFISTFRMSVNNLTLNFFEVLQGFAQIYFSGLEVLVRPPISLETSGWDITSRTHESTGQIQHCVNDFYPYLERSLPSNGLCMAGLTWTDIYPKDYNFILGEASVKHRAAVISFGRFETKDFDPSSHCDVTEVDGKLMWKLIKSLSHEVCHLLGLEHCRFFHCAMNESASVTEALSHPLFLCPVCLRKLQRACGFDVLERYQQLRQFLRRMIEQLDNSQELEGAVRWLNKCVDYLNS